MDTYALLLAATLNAGTVLAIAGLGLLINERAGIVNLGAEGMMLVAAIAGFATAVHTGCPWLAFVVALLSVGTFWLFLFRVYGGFQMQVGGLAAAAARYAGFSSRRALWVALLISGGMAGLAGAFEVAGPIGQLTPYVPAGYGFAAIIVAYVGRLNPVGVLFSSLLMSLFYIGGELAQSRLGLPKSLTGVFQGVLLFSLLASDTLINYRVRWHAAHPVTSAHTSAGKAA